MIHTDNAIDHGTTHRIDVDHIPIIKIQVDFGLGVLDWMAVVVVIILISVLVSSIIMELTL